MSIIYWFLFRCYAYYSNHEQLFVASCRQFHWLKLKFEFQIAKHDNQKLDALDQFLVEYLEYIRVAEGDHFVHRHVSL